MTNIAQNFYPSAWAHQALNLYIYILLVPITSCSQYHEVCLRGDETLSCRSPPIKPPDCPVFCRTKIECPDDILISDQIISYTYSVTYCGGCNISYTVSQDTIEEVMSEECRQLPNCTGMTGDVWKSSCFPPGIHFQENTTVTCQAYDRCSDVTECSFNITIISPTPPPDPCSDFCEVCNSVQTLLIVILALNAVGWICCIIAASMPTISQRPTRSSQRGIRSVVLGDNDDDGDEAYVNELFQDIGSQENTSDDKAAGTSIDDTSTTKLEINHNGGDDHHTMAPL